MPSRPSASDIGIPTHHSRVESWECDFNQHWNARYYHRSFQFAAERIETLCGREARGVQGLRRRMVRFHRELFVGTSVEVRSVGIAGGPHDGAIMHVLSGDGVIAATALDDPCLPASVLPHADPEAMAWAMPRSASQSDATWNIDAVEAVVSETGSVRREEVDPHGFLHAEEIVRRAAIGVHHLLSRTGFTAEFTRQTSISRMSVELAMAPAGPCSVGSPLLVRSGFAEVREKSFSSFHSLETPDGGCVATTLNIIVPVDMTTRRAVAVPDFIRRPGA